jgi:S1/P1 Nuclease
MKSFILALTLVTTNAFAWGPTGHRVVGAVAEKHLDISVHSKIYKILGGQSLSRVSNWSDEIKSEPQNYSHTYNWHYTDWKDDDHQHDETNSSGKLMTAINEQVAVLKDPNATIESKNFALKFVVHLIGDLHQPLHVGNGLDQGGNKCKVVFQKKETNLHALWDEGMIDFTNLSFSELADYVAQGRTREQILSWKSGTPIDWALESKVLRGKIYPNDVIPSDAPMSVKTYCRSDVVVTADSMPKLSYEYSYAFVPVVEQRLYQAGVRLALILNEALK